MVEKRIVNEEDVEKWKESDTFKSFVDFIVQLAESVRGRENTDYDKPISDSIEAVHRLLNTVSSIIEKHPVVKDAKSSRFGKVEYRDFYDDIKGQSRELIAALSKDLKAEDIEELSVYLNESWGNRLRIDYGSGHELNFMCFLYGLVNLGVLKMETDATNIVLRLFIKYLEVMRQLEMTYWLEPAGSHGVWGLDDYHFLPFLFGAFQLSTHKHLIPKSIHNEEVVEIFEGKYLYFDCIAFINRVKVTASLRWHSPMLDDISGVKTWSKVAEGMVKMYKAEVLIRMPVMQHFYFSSFLPAPEGISPPKDPQAADENNCAAHAHSGWGDCCGIPIPSAIAAVKLNNNNKRPLQSD
ncbi:HEL151Cp [Eremothecium sinecaudum]|uniref:Serine/threonine-protein phosphatase 2A activator n=1 Tax=Eremothecium sinecaudum TaxID=45286 RepID=A0A0X8HTD4_9SACH|nr:HEL151Cp [Eremothecium sinecaudum]AMD21130.1 HEL151Cp [Eremothecium sinecaudum]